MNKFCFIAKQDRLESCSNVFTVYSILTTGVLNKLTDQGKLERTIKFNFFLEDSISDRFKSLLQSIDMYFEWNKKRYLILKYNYLASFGRRGFKWTIYCEEIEIKENTIT